MSLINQMLKDLDKRGSGAGVGDAPPSPIRAVPERSSNPLLVSVIILLLLVLGGAVAWYFLQQPVSLQSPPAPPVVAATPVVPTAPVAPAPVASATPPSVDAPAAAAAAAVAVDKAFAPEAPTAASSKRADSRDRREPLVAAARTDKPAAVAPRPAPDASERAMKLSLTDTLTALEPSAAYSPPSTSTTTKASPSGRKKRGAAAEAAGTQLKETTPQQHAENAYGKAIGMLAAGQKNEAIAALESVLLQNPRQASARQTLVGLLLDAKRSADAARVLEDGLKLDPAQTGMAMILARIQIEQSGAGVALATLQRSLPHAANRPDYLAFVAALLQREKRHKEAAAFYAQALRKAPQNAHWWMGYGISLQASGQSKEARQAFVRARDLHKLTPELQAFVEQKIGGIGGV